MSYYEDLTPYIYYDLRFSRPQTVNVGWLSADCTFPVFVPQEELLDAVWNYCTVSVASMRGRHLCDFCSNTPDLQNYERKGERLALGAAEIRVFSDDGKIYAAPNLICYYIDFQHYQLPRKFLEALARFSAPPALSYINQLKTLGLDWNWTWGQGKHRPFERTDGGALYLDEFGQPASRS